MFKANFAEANPTYANKIMGSDVTEIKILDRFDSSRVDSLMVKTRRREQLLCPGGQDEIFFSRQRWHAFKKQPFQN